MNHTSKLKSTPPMGAPNATEIPAAAAAESTSRFRATSLAEYEERWKRRGIPSLPFRLGKGFIMILAQQHATCTSGPSFPSHNPDATERHFKDSQYRYYVAKYRALLTNPKDLMVSVHGPMKCRMT